MNIEGPLTTKEASNGTFRIIDRDTKEDYGWIEGDNLHLYNHEIGGEEGIVPVYPLEKVESVRLAHEFFHVIVKTTDGKEHLHIRGLRPSSEQAQMTEVEIKAKYKYDEARNDPRIIAEIFKAVYPAWKDLIWYDVVRMRIIINRLIISDEYKWVAITGTSDDLFLNLWASMHDLKQERVVPTFGGKAVTKEFTFKPLKEVFYDVITMLAHSNPHDPFLETIRRTEWDGTPRLDTFLSDLGGRAHLPNEDWEREYLMSVSRGIFLAGIQRHKMIGTPQPLPFIPVFISDQYVGKSDLVSAIGLVSHATSTNKSLDDVEELYYNVQGKTIVELREATQFSADTVETMKAFADTAVMQIRLKYDKMPTENIPVTFLPIATTNNAAILQDDSGNRRFFVVYFEPNFDPSISPVHRRVSEYFIDPNDRMKGVKEEMYQLWAEALVKYDDPEKPQRWNTHMFDPNGIGFKRLYNIAQTTATTNLDWEVQLMQWIDKKYPKKGDLVESYKIKVFLENDSEGPMLKGKDLTTAMKKLGRSTNKYDLRKVKDLNTLDHGHYKVYVRTADAVFTEDSNLENVRDITDYADDPLDLHYA